MHEQEASGGTTYVAAIAEALWEEMERDDRVVLLGGGIGGEGDDSAGRFAGRFGATRVLPLPVAPDAIVGIAVGAALEGLRPVAGFRSGDHMTGGFDQIVRNAGRHHYRSGVPIPLVLRAPSGGGMRRGPFRSTSPEAFFAHAPGLKVMCPAFPSDAKGLMKSAIRDDNPCVVLEHRWLYRRVREEVPADPEVVVPIGTARVRREGRDVSVIAYGAMVHRALDAARDLAQDEGISVEVLDLRTVSPLDTEAILASVGRTGRAVVLYESHRAFGVGAEVSAVIVEQGFDLLDGPVLRVAPPNVPVPFSPSLEDAYLPQVEDIMEAVKRLARW